MHEPETGIDIRERIEIIGTKAGELPTVSILYYAQKLCDNYAKIAILDKISEILKNDPSAKFVLDVGGIPKLPSKFYAMKRPEFFNSGERFQVIEYRRHTNYYNVHPYIAESSNEYNIHFNNFFEKLIKRKNPLVYQIKDNKLKNIYDYCGMDAIKIESLTYKCPPEFIILGIIRIIKELLNGIWECEEHNERMKGLRIDNEIKRWSLEAQEQQAKIESQSQNDKIESEIMIYRDRIIENQTNLNEEYGIGIKGKNIDKRA